MFSETHSKSFFKENAVNDFAVLQFSDMKFELVLIHSLSIFIAELICLIDHIHLLIEICFQFNE